MNMAKKFFVLFLLAAVFAFVPTFAVSANHGELLWDGDFTEQMQDEVYGWGNISVGNTIIVTPRATGTLIIPYQMQKITMVSDGDVSFAGNIVLLDRGIIEFDTTSGNISCGGVISGTGELVKTGTGTLTLTGANTYTGSTTNESGTLIIGTAQSPINIIGGLHAYGGTTTVRGNVDGERGVNARDDAEVTVFGNVRAFRDDAWGGVGVVAGYGATVTVHGNVSGLGGGTDGWSLGIEAFEGATVEVNGNVTGEWLGIEAYDDATITVNNGNVYGDVIVYYGSEFTLNNGNIFYNLYAEYDSKATVNGDVRGGLGAYENSTITINGGDVGGGALAQNSTIAVTNGSIGFVTAYEDSIIEVGANVVGDLLAYGSTITVGGNVEAIGADSHGVAASDNAVITIGGNISSSYLGVSVESGAQVTVNGTITASVYYISINGTPRTQESGTASATKAGFLEYTDGESFVWVGYKSISDEWTVTFNLADGTHIGGGLLSQTVSQNGAALAPVVSRSGWVFDGWDRTFNNVTGNITVTAQWLRLGAVATGGKGNPTSADLVWLARHLARHAGFEVLPEKRVANLRGEDRDAQADDITALLRWLVGYDLDYLIQTS
jgi:autotransporter-associated beta strand protein